MLSVLFGLWFALLIFPQALYPHHTRINGRMIYSNVPLTAAGITTILKAQALIEASELFDPTFKSAVFIATDNWRTQIIKPFDKSFGFSYPITENIFIARADLADDRIESAFEGKPPRHLSAVLAHEVTHGLIRRHFGTIQARFLPNWMVEGYCDYISHESSFPEAEGIALMVAHAPETSGSYRYFVYRKMIQHLMDGKGFSFAQIVQRKPEFDTTMEETLKALDAKPK